MIAPSSSQVSETAASAGARAARVGSGFASASVPVSVSEAAGPQLAPVPFKCVSFMRHSIATHNEAAATSADAIRSVYLSEAFADSRCAGSRDSRGKG